MTSGWCQSHGKPDQWHEVCCERIAAGLIAACDCPQHANDNTEDAA